MQETKDMQVQSLGLGDSLEKGMATPIFLPREFPGQRRLAGYNPWGHKELETPERVTLPLSYTADLLC